MRSRRGTASIVASPVLVGAVTVLIVVVSVFLAYNANQGLPFVPTYNVSAELPGAANLVRGNEVRVGGFRVGVIDEIRTRTLPGGRAIAVLDMKLDKIVEPLSTDTRVLVRPRSALGLKYVELTPGRSRQTYAAGDTIPVRQATQPVEFDDFLGTFDQQVRDDSRTALEGFGDAFAGRGASINAGLDELPEFFRHLGSVMSVLNDPDTGLDQFFLQIGKASAQVAPVAEVQAELFSNMADTFEAFSRNPEALRATIEKAPPTLDASIRSFRAQTPFLINFTDLSRRLRSPVRTLDAVLPTITAAIDDESQAVLRDTRLTDRTRDVLAALDTLASDRNTKLGLMNLDDTLRVGAPLVEYLAPYQTVCNHFIYFAAPLGNHFGQALPNGAAQRALNNSDNAIQDNRSGSGEADRPADVPANEDPQTATDGTPRNLPLTATHGQPYGPAIDAQGNADCQNGQTGYLNRLVSNGRYPPVSDENTNNREDRRPGQNPPETWSQRFGGGSHVVADADTPGLAGPTFVSRKLGIFNLDDVDRVGLPYHNRGRRP